ncbi:MAG: hypothetical protein N2440_06345 [Actinobacteria bacterium]|nr:hypothetical protein [Actinomycetota bacterium]
MNDLKPVLTDAKVVKLQGVAKGIFELLLKPEIEMPEPQPFQFVSLHYGSFQLRRPFSVAGFKEGLLRVVFKIKGRMTEELASLRIGEKISLMGPLGSAFDYSKYKRVLAVAGGIGIAPFLYFFSKEVNSRDISLIYGVKTLEEAWYEEIFTDLKGFLLVTEDGSSNYYGYPVDYIIQVSSYFNPDAVVVVGPQAMLESLIPVTFQLNVPFFVSLEPYMGCSLGACGSCLVKLSDGTYVKACTEGPVFDLKRLSMGGVQK